MRVLCWSRESKGHRRGGIVGKARQRGGLWGGLPNREEDCGEDCDGAPRKLGAMEP